jgi:hypothetical protein
VKRFVDWPERLAAYFESVRSTPFAWGSHDCATFCNDVIRVITGIDRWPALPNYSTARGAMRITDRGGLLSLVELSLGEPVAPSYARRGDVVFYLHPKHGPALGICNGDNFAAPGDAGLEFESMIAASHAWHIG